MTQFAFVFPGQGSQTVGMLADMAATHPVVEETFREASAALGYDLWALVQQGPAEELNKTRQTQPALLTASVALWRVWQQQGGKTPALMAGHSTGEYSALVCAGVIRLQTRCVWLNCAVNSCRKPCRKVLVLWRQLSVWMMHLLPKHVKSPRKGRLFLR